MGFQPVIEIKWSEMKYSMMSEVSWWTNPVTLAKFGDFSFSRFCFIVRTDRQTESHNYADDRYTDKTTAGVTK